MPILFGLQPRGLHVGADGDQGFASETKVAPKKVKILRIKWLGPMMALFLSEYTHTQIHIYVYMYISCIYIYIAIHLLIHLLID